MPQRVATDIHVNQANMTRFVEGVLSTLEAKGLVLTIGHHLSKVLDDYYQMLLERHAGEGIAIHGDPVTTDLTMLVFQYVDVHGEVQAGRKPDEISAYGLRKAKVVVETVTSGTVGEFVGHPGRFSEFVAAHMKQLWKVATELHRAFAPVADRVTEILGVKKAAEPNDVEFSGTLNTLADLDPRLLTFVEKAGCPDARGAARARVPQRDARGDGPDGHGF